MPCRGSTQRKDAEYKRSPTRSRGMGINRVVGGYMKGSRAPASDTDVTYFSEGPDTIFHAGSSAFYWLENNQSAEGPENSLALR